MLVEKRKFRVLVVVEQNTNFPSTFIVTLLAFFAEPTLMYILFCVARHAVDSQLFKYGILFVACLTCCRQMLAEERELCVPVVIESDFAPRLCRVAAFAFQAVLTLVLVLLAMTIVAELRNAFPALSSMTSRAFRWDVCAG